MDAYSPYQPFLPLSPDHLSLDAADWLSRANFGAGHFDFGAASTHPHQAESNDVEGLPAQPTPTTPEKRIPRPRNAFMIFRSAFWAEQKIHRNVERDHRHISRIIGHCWNKMSEEEKDVWRRKADQEKMEHELKHPGYRFSPTARTKKPVKRKVKRNGAGDLLRCEKVAELLLSGKAGEDLEEAVKSLGPPVDEELMVLASPICETSISSMPSKSDEPPFRSPLLAPASVQNSTTRHLCSPELSPAGDAFLRYSPPSSPQTSSPDQFPEYRAHIMAANQTPPSKSVLFQAPVVPPLAYSVYNVQAAACDPARQSFDLNLDPIQYVHPLAPRSPTSPYYETFAPFDRTTVPPLPAPASLANVMAEPVEWNATYAFSR